METKKITLANIRNANPLFFNKETVRFFKDKKIYLQAGELHVETGSGSHAVYSIEPKTLELRFSRHAD